MKQFGKPPKGLNPEEEKAEADKIRDEIDKFNETRLDIKRDFTEQGIFGKRESSFRENYAPLVDNLGKGVFKEKREHIDKIIDDAAARQRGLAAELKQKRSVFMSGQLKNAIDAAVNPGDSRAYSPKVFHEALKKVEEAAEKTGNIEIGNWCRNKGAYFGNRIKELESKGVSSDLTLDYQRQASREGRKDYLDLSLKMFNTKRSKVFGKGENRELGKELPEHKALREAAEKLLENKKKLDAMEDKNSINYRTAASELIKDSQKVQRLALKCLQEKNLSAITGAGGQRLNGALLIRREAKLIEASLTKEVEMINRYMEMEKKTHLAKLNEMQKQGDYAGIVEALVNHELAGINKTQHVCRRICG